MNTGKGERSKSAAATPAEKSPGDQNVESSGEEPKGAPTSDRHFSETSAHCDGGNAAAGKHSHKA
jgi:hypothetical protein